MKYFRSQGRHQTSRWHPPTQSSVPLLARAPPRQSWQASSKFPAMDDWQAKPHASRWRRGDWIWGSNSKWDADGSIEAGWPSWTGGDGCGDDDWSSGRRVDSDPMEKRIELLEERVSRIELLEERVSSLGQQVSSLEKEVAALRQAGQAAVASPEPNAACAPLLAQPPHGHACEWHEHRPDAGDVSVDGN